MPTGSCPIVSPRATGYSPFRICTSVPQMVVVVMRIRASSGPTSGIGLSSSTIRFGSTKIAAFIILVMGWNLLSGTDAKAHPGSTVNLVSVCDVDLNQLSVAPGSRSCHRDDALIVKQIPGSRRGPQLCLRGRATRGQHRRPEHPRISQLTHQSGVEQIRLGTFSRSSCGSGIPVGYLVPAGGHAPTHNISVKLFSIKARSFRSCEDQSDRLGAGTASSARRCALMPSPVAPVPRIGEAQDAREAVENENQATCASANCHLRRSSEGRPASAAADRASPPEP